MILDLLLISLTIASVVHAYRESEFFIWAEEYVERIPSSLALFLFILLSVLVYFKLPIFHFVYFSAASAYGVLMIVILINAWRAR